MRKIQLLAASMAALAVIGVLGCAPAKKAKAHKPDATATATVSTASVAVSATTITPTNMDEHVPVTGTLLPVNQVSVGTRIAGRVAWVIGKEGTPVHRGEVVVRMEDQDAHTQVRSARAAVDAAQARVEQAKAAALQQTTSTTSGIVTAKAALDAARARLKQARATADAQQATSVAQVKAAQAALDSANSRLDVVHNGARTQERTIAENAVRLAQATYDNDKANYERYKGLYDQKAIAKSALDGAETKMQVSAAQFDSAKQQLSLIQVGARPEDIQNAEAAVRQAENGLATARANMKQVDVANANVDIAVTGVSQAQAELLSARSAHQVDVMRSKDVLAAQATLAQAKEALCTALQNLDYTQIYSPVDGVVSAKITDVGQTVAINVAVLQLTTDQSLYFEASVSELDATRLRAGQPVSLTVDALQGDRGNTYGSSKVSVITGTVDKVVPVVDAKSRNFTIRILVPKSQALFPGMFARGQVIVARHQHITAVPKEAIVEKDNQQVVFVVENKIARLRPVVPGASNGTLVQILKGVSVGERVITIGQQTLRDGDQVQVVDKSPAQ